MGVLPEHYPLVGHTLLKIFEKNLDDVWTSDIKQAWVVGRAALSQLHAVHMLIDPLGTQAGMRLIGG